MRGVLYVMSNWDTKDAEVVCRMLGYPGVQQVKTTNFSPVKGISLAESTSIVLVQRRQLATAVVVGHGDILSVGHDALTLVCRVRWVSYVYNKYCCVCVF